MRIAWCGIVIFVFSYLSATTHGQYFDPVDPLTAHGDHMQEDHREHDHSSLNLTGINLSHANLTGTVLSFSNLTDARFVKANLSRADLRSTTSSNAIFTEANLSRADLSSSTLKNANFKDANLNQSNLIGTDLSGANFNRADLSSSKLTNANLTEANLSQSILTNANLIGAVVARANFDLTTPWGFSYGKLRSTASYQAQDLQGIGLANNDLSGWDFSGQNLSNANLGFASLQRGNYSEAHLIGANFGRSTLHSANFARADLRGAFFDGPTGAIFESTILPDGKVQGLVIHDQQVFTVRDDDGVPNPAPSSWLLPRGPIPVTIGDKMTMSPASRLQLVFAGNDWGSTVQFQIGIPVQLGGTLDLTFDNDVPFAANSSRTFKAFDWTGVMPSGEFSINTDPGAIWDTTNLYTRGEVTLLGWSGDMDDDQDVDSVDLLNLIGNWTGSENNNTRKTWHEGDSDNDGDIDSADLLVLISLWTGTADGPPIQVSSRVHEISHLARVPEPSNAISFRLTGLALMAPTRRKRKVLIHGAGLFD